MRPEIVPGVNVPDAPDDLVGVGDKADLKVQDGYDELPMGVVKDANFQPIVLEGDEADLWGSVMMNLVLGAMNLGTLVEQDKEEHSELELAALTLSRWGAAMQELIDLKAAQSGYGGPIA